MQAWWRVLRGVYPYRWSVIISMICAIGVGLSYASGVTVMYPVMKIFISNEGLQGWAYRMAAQSRLGVEIEDLDATNTLDPPRGIRILRRTDKVASELQDAG